MVDEGIIKDPLRYIPEYLKVLTKPDKKGMSQLVLMNLYPVQKHYIENATHRDIVVKARQMRFSTGVMARNAHRLFTIPYTKVGLVAHNQDTAEFLLQTVHRFHRNLPDVVRPKADWRSGSRIRFPDLDSLIHIDSAESRAIGFGETLNLVHLTELSRWPANSANELFAGITQTVPMGGYITIESTPRGRGGLFYNLYQAAKRKETTYQPFFYPWWWEPEYIFPVEGKLELTKEEQLLMNQNDLSNEQIAFRRQKISELGDIFFQEYPENDADCWLTTEMGVFDPGSIRRYLMQIQAGREEGNLTVWKDVIGGEKYVIGIDVAGGVAKGDFSVAAVFNVRRREYVARLRGRIPPDLFTEQILQLGRRYNMAVLGVERAQHGHTVLQLLLQNNYPELYYHQDYDTLTGDASLQPGWKTNVKTKPIMVDTLIRSLRANDIMLWSENFLTEASSYVWNGQSAGAGIGAFDDELDAVMIALQLAEQAPLIEPSRASAVSYVKVW